MNELEKLAGLIGIITSYRDSREQLVAPPPEAVLATINAMSIPIGSASQAGKFYRELLAKKAEQITPPVLALWDGSGELPLTLTPERQGEKITALLSLEGREKKIRKTLYPENLTVMAESPEPKIPYKVYRLPISQVPYGYHKVQISIGRKSSTTLLISAPTQAYVPPELEEESRRFWGLFAPLHSIWDQYPQQALKSFFNSIGNISLLRKLYSLTIARGGKFVATLPLLATFCREPFSPSPYTPISRLFWNELFLDITATPEFQKNPRSFEELLTAQLDSENLSTPFPHRWVDYRREYSKVRKALEIIVDTLSFQTYSEIQNRLKNDKLFIQYCRFLSAGEKKGGQPWREWPKTLRNKNIQSFYYTKRELLIRAAGQHYIQKQLEQLSRQTRREGLGLFLDLPVGVHRYGFDTWYFNKLFAMDASIGAPPDAFFRGGQNWDLPPILPQKLLESKLKYWILSLQNVMKFAGVLRIDHIMQLRRLFWIPQGFSPTEGVYVSYPADPLAAAISLESHRNKTIVVGEDLGTVPEKFRSFLKEHRFFQTKVFSLFRPSESDESEEFPKHSVLSLNTHDMPTFAALWTGRDLTLTQRLNPADTETPDEKTIEDRNTLIKETVKFLQKEGFLPQDFTPPQLSHLPRELKLSPSEKKELYPLLRASLSFLSSLPPGLLSISLDDLTLSPLPQNIPATSDETYPNWRSQLPRPLSELLKDGQLLRLLQTIHRYRKKPARTLFPPEKLEELESSTKQLDSESPDTTPAPPNIESSKPKQLESESPDTTPAPPNIESSKPTESSEPLAKESSSVPPKNLIPSNLSEVSEEKDRTSSAGDKLEDGSPPPESFDSAEGRPGGADSSEDWGELDDYLFAEGTHSLLYRKLGSHPVEGGYRFRVWAPNARSVSVIGDFNSWQSGRHPLSKVGARGVWEGTVEGLGKGSLYKYAVVSQGGKETHRADPFAFCTEEPPKTASLTWELSYSWGDGDWMEERGSRQTLESPISIYEVHLGSWIRDPFHPDRFLSYREVGEKLADYVSELGFTHVELLPLLEHPFYGSWGYQATGYFAPTRRYGVPEDLMYLIDLLHRRGIGVWLDWVPSHFPRDDFGLAFFDGSATYEYADPRKGFHPDWTDNIFDYGKGEVRSFLLSSGHFWLERYHLDGLRLDGVASMLYLDYSRRDGEWVPNRYGGNENLEAIEFLKGFNRSVKGRFADVLISAEESTAWPGVTRSPEEGGLGFDLKWDMGWMHDTLEYFKKDPIYRKYHHSQLTFRMVYSHSENYILPLSHDEVVHGKGSLYRRMPGDHWQKMANLRLLYGYMYGLPGKKLLFMGQEFGMIEEWNHDVGLDWHLLKYPLHRGLQRFVADLNRIYRNYPALHRGDCHPSGFRWSVVDDADNSVLIWLRTVPGGGETPVLVACNFTPVPRYNYVCGVPSAGRWREILNSDSSLYGGSNVGNMGFAVAEGEPWGQWPARLTLNLPPLGVLFFAFEGGK